MYTKTAPFNVGDRVELKAKGKYSKLTVGLKGTVFSVYGTSIAVKIDGMHNKSSQYGAYYFKAQELVLTEEIETRKESKIMEGKYLIADACYLSHNSNSAYPEENANTYAFALYDTTIIEGDYCVVKSNGHGFDIVKIQRLRERSDEAITREIVCKVDFSAYVSRLDARKRRDELRNEMAKKAAQLQEIAMYQILAESDPAMAALLKAYKELTDGN